MTSAVSGLGADAYTDRLVAEALGWQYIEYPGGDDHWRKPDGRQIPHSQWRPSANLDDAWQVVGELLGRGWWVQITRSPRDAFWGVQIEKDGIRSHGAGVTMPLAVCRLAAIVLARAKPG